MLYGQSYEGRPDCRGCGAIKWTHCGECNGCEEYCCSACADVQDDETLLCEDCHAKADAAEYVEGEPECSCTEVYVDVDRSERGEGPCAIHDREPV